MNSPYKPRLTSQNPLPIVWVNLRNVQEQVDPIGNVTFSSLADEACQVLRPSSPVSLDAPRTPHMLSELWETPSKIQPIVLSWSQEIPLESPLPLEQCDFPVEMPSESRSSSLESSSGLDSLSVNSQIIPSSIPSYYDMVTDSPTLPIWCHQEPGIPVSILASLFYTDLLNVASPEKRFLCFQALIRNLLVDGSICMTPNPTSYWMILMDALVALEISRGGLIDTLCLLNQKERMSPSYAQIGLLQQTCSRVTGGLFMSLDRMEETLFGAVLQSWCTTSPLLDVTNSLEWSYLMMWKSKHFAEIQARM